jgi:hypothetical protein
MTASDAVHDSSTRHASATQALGRTKVRLLKHTAAPDVPEPIPSPPEKLRHLHFNDALLAHIAAAQAPR